MTCIDDRKKVNHNIFSRSQKHANIDCRCKKGDCTWTTHGKTDINLKGQFRFYRKLPDFHPSCLNYCINRYSRIQMRRKR